jgi:predicted nucleotidyltransferase
MLDQAAVDKWLDDFIDRLRERFGERLVFVGHHGSWARGEPTPSSDIDCLVLLDHVETSDLRAYAQIVHGMPHPELVSTFMGSVEELRVWPRMELTEVFYACKPLHGTVEGLVEAPRREDFVEHIRYTAAQVMHDTRHYLLHPHEPTKYVHRLYYRYKWAFYALNSWVFLRDGRFVGRLGDLLPLLDGPDDREVLRIVRDWHGLEEDRNARPLYYMELLEEWSRRMLGRIGAPDRPCDAE